MGHFVYAYLKKNYLYIAAAILSIILLLAGKALAVENFQMKIGVNIGVSSGKLLGRGLTLRDSKGTRASASEGAVVTASGADISVGGRKLSLPVQVSAASGLGWGSTRYRGTLKIISAPGGFTVINEVALEDYLRGILKVEMSPEWPREALKAQAVLARTFAVKNRGRYAGQGFDLDNTQNTQIYRGMNAEDKRTDAAVSETKGQVLTWNGSPADVYYHSDSGGATADIAHVWGGASAYLKPRRERVAYISPYSSWQISLTSAQIASAMRKIGKDVGNVTGVEVALLDEFGRAVRLRVRGDRGVADVTAHAFRMAVGSGVLRSTNFTVAGAAALPTQARTPAQAPETAAKTPAAPVWADSLAKIAEQADPLIEMTKSGVFTKEELLDMLVNPSKRESYLKIGYERLAGAASQTGKPANPAPAGPSAPVVVPSSGSFTFNGRGWGHGVGLSQWGAKAMADQGVKCEEILAHYFPGTKIAR
ncbi:MAG: SpoIID/LytB domain-containing protein [Synergistaceae bacterium]|jgi:stage II sporulation protein D|nr:SpoIID/LytB domain-containing protein [Synergistaceae bacterium]